jgi:hypothetical protein
MTSLSLFLCVLLPYAAALTAFWACYRYPQHRRSCIPVFLLSATAAPFALLDLELFSCISIFADVFLLPSFVILLLRILDERKYDAIPPNSFKDTADCLKDLVDCIRHGGATDVSLGREEVLGDEEGQSASSTL